MLVLKNELMQKHALTLTRGQTSQQPPYHLNIAKQQTA